jgi:hypothetical protein
VEPQVSAPKTNQQIQLVLEADDAAGGVVLMHDRQVVHQVCFYACTRFRRHETAALGVQCLCLCVESERQDLVGLEAIPVVLGRVDWEEAKRTSKTRV